MGSLMYKYDEFLMNYMLQRGCVTPSSILRNYKPGAIEQPGYATACSFIGACSSPKYALMLNVIVSSVSTSFKVI